MCQIILFLVIVLCHLIDNGCVIMLFLHLGYNGSKYIGSFSVHFVTDLMDLNDLDYGLLGLECPKVIEGKLKLKIEGKLKLKNYVGYSRY